VSAQAALQSSHVLLFVLLLVLLSSLHGSLFVAGSTDIPTIKAGPVGGLFGAMSPIGTCLWRICAERLQAVSGSVDR
jgi:hypothetical protein